jgi:hypothetical protein
MLKLVRYGFFKDRTMGRLTYGDLVFWTVEKPWQQNTPFVSCIPAGKYVVEKGRSPRFGDGIWQVKDVPNRTHILFHVGNYASDVVGCIAVGSGVMPNIAGVSSSKKAMEKFSSALESKISEWLTIEENAFGE